MASTSSRDAAHAGVPPTERAPRKRPIVLLGPLVPVVVVALAWAFGGLDRFDSPESIAEAARSLGDSPIAILYVLLGFGVGTLLFLPVTALIAGTAIAFDPARSVLYSMVGVLFGATTTYWCGRLLGARALDYLSGPRLERIKHELCTRAFRASIIARLLPVGNFTVINLLAGSLRIPFRAYFFGNAIGAAPGVVVFSLFTEQLGQAIRKPTATNIAVLVVSVLLLCALGFWLRRVVMRRERGEASGGAAS